LTVLIASVITYIKGQEDVNIMQRRVIDTVQKKALSIFVLGLLLVLTTTFILLMNNEGSFIQVLFESVSAFGTVGLSTGITPGLSALSKLQIILTMFLGRVGTLSFVVSLSLKHINRKASYKYPEGKITVG